MVNILVPTDFSALSKIALKYAIKIANKLKGNVTVVHIIPITQPIRISMRAKMKGLDQNLILSAQEDLDVLIKTVSEQYKTWQPLKHLVARGSYFPPTLLKEARKLHSGLIVMGTRGASGIARTFFGSNTASVIDLSHVPVLVVPEYAEFKGFRNVVYAADLRDLENELNVLIRYIEKFGSTIHLLHIVSEGKDVAAAEAKIESILQKFSYKNLVTLVLVDNNIDSAIDQYVEVSKADILAMFTHETSFYEKVFDKSMTRNMAFHSRIPLLAFKTLGRH
jgi:nucleotide-binding universal stress UspA family protein